MMKERIQYSPEFRAMVINLLETSQVPSIEAARRKFNIGGSMTINKWLIKAGKENIIPVLRVRSLDEVLESVRETDPKLFDVMKNNIASKN